MALVKCPKCGNSVSDKAEKCPNCGTELSRFEEVINENKANKTRKTRLVCFALLLVALLIEIPFVIRSLNDKKTIKELHSLCDYIPDHGLREDAKGHLTDSYIKAYQEALDAPVADYGEIGDNEWLYYFVSGNGDEGKIDFNFTEISKDKSVITVNAAKVINSVQSDLTGGERIRFVKEKGKWLLDDYNGTKQKCIEYVKNMRRSYKSGVIERRIKRDPNMRPHLQDFQQRVKAFYEKYGDEDPNNNIKWVNASSIDNNTPFLMVAWRCDCTAGFNCWFSEKPGLTNGDELAWTSTYTQWATPEYGRLHYHYFFPGTYYSCNFSDEFTSEDTFGVSVINGSMKNLKTIKINDSNYYLLDLSDWENWRPLYLPYSSKGLITQHFDEGRVMVAITK